MKTETITLIEAEAEMQEKAGSAEIKEWQDLQEMMRQGDELVRYSDVDVLLGFCSGDAGVALLRNSKVVAKIVLVQID